MRPLVEAARRGVAAVQLRSSPGWRKCGLAAGNGVPQFVDVRWIHFERS